jgi:hypothetical protein
MGNNSKPIPENMTIEEASAFWDTHDVADYASHVVQLEYAPEERITFVAIANQFLGQLEQRAKDDGISLETLVNLWIQEKLSA